MSARKIPTRILERHEYEQLLRCASRTAPTGIRNAAILAVLWDTGVRVGELVALELRDLDTPRQAIRVLDGKYGVDRANLGMPPSSWALLERWLRVRERQLLERRPSSPLFCTLAGRRLNDRYVRAFIDRYARRAALEHVYPHAFRHTYVSRLLEAGVNPERVRVAAGHLSLATTTIYAHARSSDQARVLATALERG